MKVGVTFPQTEFRPDPTAVRDYAQAAETLGYTHILAYDHVLGANPDRPGGWRGPYTFRDPFFEPFILYSYMAAITERIEFVTGIIILPQRQTALVAKQSATLDVLCNGRLRLGIGVGWNQTEFIGLNQDFHTRGRRVEEQIEVLRRLWTKELVTFSGRWHQIPDAGIRPLPVQRPIPIWIGGHADVVLRRVARSGDGWFPLQRRAVEMQPQLEKLDGYLAEHNRSRADIGIEPRLAYREDDVEGMARTMTEWREAGATHISVNTMGQGLKTPDQHVTALQRFAEAFLD